MKFFFIVRNFITIKIKLKGNAGIYPQAMYGDVELDFKMKVILLIKNCVADEFILHIFLQLAINVLMTKEKKYFLHNLKEIIKNPIINKSK